MLRLRKTIQSAGGRQFLWPLPLLLTLVNVSLANETRNFRSNEIEFLRSAEEARERSARFWSGQRLPGDWYSPCPMNWTVSHGPASGWTSFTFQQGEVSGWQMTLRGQRDEVLADVIPHEVDHTVRATLCRKPLPRWIDEGCASLFESQASHVRLRSMLSASGSRQLTSHSIDETCYPADPQAMTQLYAEGFSLVEYLLTRGTAQDLLKVQKSAGPLSSSLVRVYRTELPDLLADWQFWDKRRLSAGTSCSCVDCPVHRSRTAPATLAKPPLTIWTTSWCEPCRRFHADWKNHPSLKKSLESRFQIQFRDWDLNQPLAIRQHITAVPSFQTASLRFSGYQGPEWLLEKLGISPALGEPTRPPPLSAGGAPPAANEQAAADPEPTLTPSVRIAPLVIPTAVPQSAPTLPPRTHISPASESSAESAKRSNMLFNLVPVVVSVLTSLGVISGTAFTGGIGGVALMLIWKWIQHRATHSGQGKSTEGGVVVPIQAPFPRELDETGELLGLRQSEGRVAPLDALRGMFLDDELHKLQDSADPTVTAFVQKLRAAIDQRVDEVAPLSTKA